MARALAPAPSDSGDTDACVPTWGTVDWIDSLNLTVTAPWTPWLAPHLDGTRSQRAGYVKKYAYNFTFATVQGAGHMVPTHAIEFDPLSPCCPPLLPHRAAALQLAVNRLAAGAWLLVPRFRCANGDFCG